MRIKFLIWILLLSLLSCKSDDFYNTQRILFTDKKVYLVGEQIRVTMKIIPQKDKKEIRVYENYKNIDFSFSVINDKKNIYNGYWSGKSGKHLPLSNIRNLTITKEKPFIIEFVGNIGVENDYVYIQFPKLNNYKVIFKKDILKDEETYIRIHGISYPIKPELGASLEEFFNTKDFRINL